LRCRPLDVPSATLLCVCWGAELYVHAVCVVQLMLSQASRVFVSLAPRPACFYSFLYAVNDFLWSTRPHAIEGLMGLVGAGCCRDAPEFQLHQFNLIVVCNFLILELSRSNQSVGHYTAPSWRDPHVHACEPSPPRLSAIWLESPRGASSNGDSDWKA
jgi:hypothetical protein